LAVLSVAVDLAAVQVIPPSHDAWAHSLGALAVLLTLATNCTAIPLMAESAGTEKLKL
jgi:hypothetical protein